MRESRRPPFFKFIEYPREEFSLRGYFFLPNGLIGLIRPVSLISLMSLINQVSPISPIGLICAINPNRSLEIVLTPSLMTDLG